MNKEEMLKNAKKHCFFIGLNDSGAELCKANMPYGMAGIHYVQSQLGLKENATFISSPDLTITKGVNRWMSGFGYGGKISWGEGDEELVILDMQPDACGMLVGGLQELPEIDGLIQRAHEAEAGSIKIDGIDSRWNFSRCNHFIDVFEVQSLAKSEIYLPPYAFIVHGSIVDEFGGDSKLGFGLHYNTSKLLGEMVEHIDTPFGRRHFLTGSKAGSYFERYQYAEDFSKKKRIAFAKLLFGEFTEISNENHQGLINMNEMILGCHYLKEKDETLFPLTLRADLPAYLVRGIPNLSPESIEFLGFEKRAERLGVYDRLLKANIIPHGGGYVFPHILGVNRTIEVKGKRYFEVEMQNDRGTEIIAKVNDLPFEYRGRTVVLRSLEVGLIEIVAKLTPQYVLKI
ncbi:hypothetical protein KJ693_09710 [bacterium]|nr:hypothetical protein [bacterium]MBU1615569.1 hypothetical protein [bacterium]